MTIPLCCRYCLYTLEASPPAVQAQASVLTSAQFSAQASAFASQASVFASQAPFFASQSPAVYLSVQTPYEVQAPYRL